MRSALIVAGAQYFAVILGVYWSRAHILVQPDGLGPWRWARFFCDLDLIYGIHISLPVPSVRGIEWILIWHLEACLADLAIAIAGLRILASLQLRQSCRNRMWLCLSLSCYVAWLMYTEPFVGYRGDVGFVTGVVLLTPALLAFGPLVRYREWPGLVCAVVFLAASLAMLIDNGCRRGGEIGFFYAVVW